MTNSSPDRLNIAIRTVAAIWLTMMLGAAVYLLR
jgi:hypothetical protein